MISDDARPLSSAPVLARARLRRDVPAQALAHVLVPEQPGAQISAAHGLVWALFADSPDRRRDFIWRQTSPGEFLILAARPPSDRHGLFVVDYKPFVPTLRPGQLLQFDLRANPVASVLRGPELRGKRNDVVMHALSGIAKDDRAATREQVTRNAGAAWLARQGEAAGFVIAPDRLHIDGYDRVRIPRCGHGDIVFSVLRFQGVLTVEDPARFVPAVVRGFGAAKAFGYGLMLVRRSGP